jgi:hypothetical protein
MLLIISGQYVESELYAEFGKIPPAFLPLGNERLYTHQVGQLAKAYDRVAMTIPSDFEIDASDVSALEKLGVALYRTSVGSGLGAAVREALDKLGTIDRIDILYGDTLVYADEIGGADWIGVGGSDDFYPWHYENSPVRANQLPGVSGLGGLADTAYATVLEEDSTNEAWAGIFSFSNAGVLRRILGETEDFIQAVTRYGDEYILLERRSLKRWLDFGHVHTYFNSRLAVTTQRHFNELKICDGVLTKSSSDSRKMAAEAAWFANAPPAVRLYLPGFISASARGEHASYSIEYLPLTSLNELYVFGRLPVKVWTKIYAACGRYLSAERSVPMTDEIAGDPVDSGLRLYREKTLARLEEFGRKTGVDTEKPWVFNGANLPSLKAMAEEAAAAVNVDSPVPSFVHGDFCFSNILYDFRSDRVKLIDPRGLDVDGRLTPFGDFRYDIGKLAHSVLGLYDVIIAGRFNLRIIDHEIQFEILHESSLAARAAFLRTGFAGKTPDEWNCQPVMVLLFLSMLPLHADKPLRQKALMANCMRIYQDWKA